MALATTQTIQAGSGVLLIGDVATDVISSAITTNINQAASPSGYSAVATALVVDDASTIAPDVWETSTGTIGNPAVYDMICNIRTGEVMACYSRTDSTETINVIRGVGIYWTKTNNTLTQYNVAINDDDELQLLGSGTLPTTTDAVVSVDDIVINATYDTFRTMDNQKGYETTYTSAPADVNFTISLPRNTLPETMRTVGIQGLTDGNIPATYFTEPGKQGAGTTLPKKFIVFVPNDVFFAKSSVTISLVDYLDFSKCYVFPTAQFDLNQTVTKSNGSQTNLDTTFYASYDNVWQKCCQFGALNDFMRLTEQV